MQESLQNSQLEQLHIDQLISFDEQLAKISLIDVGNIISIKLDQSSRLHGCAAFGESALLAILPNGLAALPIS